MSAPLTIRAIKIITAIVVLLATVAIIIHYTTP